MSLPFRVFEPEDVLGFDVTVDADVISLVPTVSERVRIVSVYLSKPLCDAFALFCDPSYHGDGPLRGGVALPKASKISGGPREEQVPVLSLDEECQEINDVMMTTVHSYRSRPGHDLLFDIGVVGVETFHGKVRVLPAVL